MVDLAASRLGLVLDYDATALKAQVVTVRAEEGLSDPELWTLVNHLLVLRGFTTVRTPGQPGSFSVVKLADAPGLAPAEPETAPAGEAGEAPRPGYRSVIIRSVNRPTKELVEAIGKVLSKPTGSIVPLGEGGRLLISDLSPRVDQALALLAALDAAPVKTVVVEVPLTSLSPQQMVTLIAQVTGKRELVASASGGGSPAGARPDGSVPGEVLAGPDPAAVLVVAPEDRVEYWKGLIAQLDRRGRLESVTYSPGGFPIKDVAKLIEQSVRAPSGTGGGAAPGADDRFRVLTDELTGSLIITASPAQHEGVRAVLARLEATPAAARRPVRSFVIKNRPVREVQTILEDLLQAGVLQAAAENSATPVGNSAGGNSPVGATSVTAMPPPPSAVTGASPTLRGAGSSPQAGLSPPRSGESSLVLAVDEATNTLMAVGEPRLLDQVQVLLSSLDVRQSQVMLEVLMVTLSDSQSLDLGVELEKLQVSGDTLVRLSSLFGLGTRTAGGDRDGPANASGFTGVVLNPGDFSVVLRALETLNRGRSVSLPRLLVANNQPASFDSVLEQPFASVNASNTVSTTSFGGVQSAGTVVTIRPQIAEGDHLNLEYSVSLSSFLGSPSSPTLPPPRQQNRVQSVASIPDGHTVVVGGIEVQTVTKTTGQVPLLGSIPFIGEAFKNRSNTDSRSRFFVFVRANIMRSRSFEDLKYLSEGATAAAQVDDGWPELEPVVIP